MNIKPGDPNNFVDTEKPGRNIQVAILGTPEFDATQVDAGTLAFGPSGAASQDVPGTVYDGDGDGQVDDLRVRFRTGDTGITCEHPDDFELSGETFSGDSFVATDFVTTPECDDGCHP